MSSKLNVAIVGAGISGLSAAWLLSKKHNVTLFEGQAHLGGHANTVEIDTPDGRVAVDTGFIVYNPPNYPNLSALFEHLGVATQPAPMTFALSLEQSRFEYSGTDLNGFFGQRRNLLRAGHWRLLAEIARFFKTALDRIEAYPDHTTLGAFLNAEGYSSAFIDDHIVPMGAAIWSSKASQMLAFPANTFISFYANHAMLQFLGRAKWRTVCAGSRTYVDAIVADSKFAVAPGAVRVLRRSNTVHIEDVDGIVRRFDHVVMASHADQTLELLSDADALEAQTLGAFAYQENVAVLHSDPRFMPQRRRLWSSWNYLKRSDEAEDGLCVTYWMNELQSLPCRSNLFVTLNPPKDAQPRFVHKTVRYEHPLFDRAAIGAQSRLWAQQGRRNTWFAGAYLGYGFHEDGLQSGLAVAEAIGGVRRPWTVENENGRIAPARDEAAGFRFAAE